MPHVPEVRYARSGDLSIAYVDVGEGEPVVVVPGFISHVELNWEAPFFAPALERLAAGARLVTFDKRGTGLSDRTLGFGTLEERMDDVRAVMDASCIERASLVGISEGGPLALLFAATYPHRVDKLALYGTYARLLRSESYEGLEPSQAKTFVDMLESRWNSGRALKSFAQHRPDDASSTQLLARVERYTATPKMVAEVMTNNIEVDVRGTLSSVSAPTLVVHCVGDPLVPISAARYLATHISGARIAEIPGDFHLSWRVEDQKLYLEPIEEFLIGRVAPAVIDRVLTTVLFTDIVDSTKRASHMGDAEWRKVLDTHDKIVREEIGRYRGREVNTTGDGFLATFDGPARAVHCAETLTRRVRECGIEIRAGVHTGECELRGDDVAGIAVHVGARVMSLAGPGEVLATRTVRDLVAGSDLQFEARGEHALKGVDEPVTVFAAIPTR